MAIIKNTNNKRHWQSCREKHALVYFCWDCKAVQSLWKAAWKFIKRLEIEPPYNPALLLLSTYLKLIKSIMYSDTYLPTCILLPFTIAK